MDTFKPEHLPPTKKLGSFYHIMARFAFEMFRAKHPTEVLERDLGIMLWRHGWVPTKFLSDNVTPTCYHGSAMKALSDNQYRLGPETERGREAMKEGHLVEQAKNGNKWVVVTNKNKFGCFHDKDHKNSRYPHTGESCGCITNNITELELAFLNFKKTMLLKFPNVAEEAKLRLQNHMFILTKCMCNYMAAKPSAGRQLGKLGYCQIPGASLCSMEDATTELSAMMIKYPFELTMSCCNPAFGFAKKSHPYNNCDLYIGQLAIKAALDHAREMMRLIGPDYAKFSLAEFRYTPKNHNFKPEIMDVDVVVCEEVDAEVF
ncbi:DBP [White sturgeon adenovirus 1]|uniref:DBP n=1 Tax=White sturgeon adenovirus 1 TaxID=2580388 RepID=A0A4P8PNC5_9ADEN|nr:DBP [White sturgeon adenovirus 1]QCQ84160.1 DBP [White sturgeon adenovirus 1]